MSQRQRGQGGFTLVELMIGLVIASIVIFFLLSIHGRMSRAFKAQSRLADVVQTLRGARAYLLADLRMAGYALPEGQVDVAPGVATSGLLPGLEIVNDAAGEGPDEIRVLYGRAGDILVDQIGPVWMDVNDASGLVEGERIIMASRSAACLVEITGINPAKVHFNPNQGGLPFNHAPQNRHCDRVRDSLDAGEEVRVLRLAMRAYRIEPGNQVGILQLSESGGVADDWVDLGIGFTNLQVATRFFEEGDTADVDGDGDAERDWYASDNQEAVDATGVRPLGAVPTELSLSLEARTPLGSIGTPSSATPAFVDVESVDHNRFGDWGQPCPDRPSMPVCGVDLAGTPDAARPLRYRGEHIYRGSTTLIDLRNLGVGR